MKILHFILGLSVIALFSCGHKNKFNINDYVQADHSDLEYSVSESEIRIPYSESAGVKTLKCLINGTILTDMILDSGCSGTLISIEEARYLAAKGALTANDYMGQTHSQIADGSIVEDAVFNIKSIVIADQIECTNVTVTVSSNSNAPLLLGNEVLDRLPQWTVDNRHQEIVFKLK